MPVVNRPPRGDEFRKLGNHMNMFEVIPQAIPNMSVQIRAGSFWTNGTNFVEFAGGNSPLVVKPTTGAKWVIYGISNAAAIRVLEGTSALNNPQFPVIPKGTLPCAAAYVQANTTAITTEMLYDLRPIFMAGAFPTEHSELTGTDVADIHPISAITGLSIALDARPTAESLSEAMTTKADADGTPEETFKFGKGRSGVPAGDVVLEFERGDLPSAFIKFNESADIFEFSHDGGTTYTALGEALVDLSAYQTRAEAEAAYSAISHDHDGSYAAPDHNHDVAYAASSHDHDADYAPIANSHAPNTDTIINLQPTREIYVDVNRTDDYAQDGSVGRPFKTIQMAIDLIAARNDDNLNPYNILIHTGKYYENLSIESLNIHRFKLTAVGVVQLRPTTGNALTSITNNTGLRMFHLKGITFLAPVVITSAAAAASFDDVIWEDCNFVAGDGSQKGTLTVTCVNSLTIRRAFHYGCNITLNNVNYGLIEGGSIGSGSLLSVTMDSAADLPAWGAQGGVIISGSILTGTPSFALAGPTKNYQLVSNFSRIATSGSAVTIPEGMIATANSSFLRGTWTNNGSLALRNSFVEVLAGIAPSLMQPASQIGNDSTVTGANVKAALETLAPIGGATADRPLSPALYVSYFDSDLDKPIWHKGSDVWVDATGAVV